MSLPLGICDRCTKPATAVLHHDGGAERYCEEHFEGSMTPVGQVPCADCGARGRP